MEATETICLYKECDKTFIAEVFEGQKYFPAIDVSVFIGTKEDFKKQYPDYEYND